MAPRDILGRPLGSLRISVTDRCNLRCNYCMPEDEYVWLPRQSILSFEEITRLTRIFADSGVRKVRITGGEPLLRKDLPQLVGQLAAVDGLNDLALTTNAVLLASLAAALREAGLHRVTVSLDTLRPDRYRDMMRGDRLDDVLEGIRAAREVGFRDIKLNTVVMRGVNDDEIDDLLRFARAHGLEVRFIEYMDVGGATRWSAELVVSRREILTRIERSFGSASPRAADDPAAPADRFILPDGTTFGVIASTTSPFCRTCDRSRVTADGTWYLCLYAAEGVDLKGLLRGGASDATIAKRIHEVWTARADRGAEERAALPGRGTLFPLQSLRADPRKEMHTRGG